MPIILVLLCALALLCPAQEARTPRKNPYENDAAAAETGRLAFRIYCAPCHGIHAKGGLGPDLTRGTYSAGETDADLYRTIHNGVPGTEMPEFSEINEDLIWRLVAYIRSTTSHDSAAITGDSAAGEKIFWTKGGCGGCHRVGGKGGSLGPDLTRVGRQRSFAYLRDSVIEPDAEISPGFETITVVTRDGKKIVGVQRGYDNFTAQLVDASGKFYSFDKGEVTSMKREFRSLMPDTYKQKLTATELNDLLAYLSKLKGVQ